MNDVDLSIIIVNYNTRDLLRSCLTSIAAAGKNRSIETIVIDNASTDGSVEHLQREHPSVIVVENTDNVGFSKACNQGMRISRGQYILLLNSDTQLLPDTLMNLWPRMFGELREERTGIVGCRILNPDGTLQYSYGRFPSLASTVGDLFRPLSERKYLLDGYDRAHEVDWVTGAFLLIRKEVIEQIGFLDERFFMYYEEVDWCLRAQRHGWNIAYDPSASIIHKTPLATKKKRMTSRIAIEIRKSHLYYFRKNRPAFELILLSIATLVLLGLAWMRWRIPWSRGGEELMAKRQESSMIISAVWRTVRDLRSSGKGRMVTGE